MKITIEALIVSLFLVIASVGMAAAGPTETVEEGAFSPLGGASSAACVASDTQLCLDGGRFSVSVTWRNQQGQTGDGRVLPAGGNDSGMFWFFDDDNWELLIKVLNGCAINSHYWVFFAATTDQEFTVTVTDLSAGKIAQYTNPLKNPADAVTDTSAFATCP
jgi:hypothetical protein